MVKGDRDFDRIDPDHFLQQAASNLHELGWPKWPPDEPPAFREWWRQELSIPPSRLPIFDQFVEIIGTPQAGKSKLLMESLPLLSSSLQNSRWGLRFEPETLVRGRSEERRVGKEC